MTIKPSISPPSAPSSAARTAAAEDPHHDVRVRLIEGRSRGASLVSEVIAGEPDLSQSLGPSRSTTRTTAPRRQDADVVVIDYGLCGPDSLAIASDLQADVDAPPVLVYTDTASPEVTIAAVVAGADGVVHRAERGVADAIRWVAAGSRWLPDVPLSDLSRAAARLSRTDVAILGMLLNGISHDALATSLGLTGEELMDRRREMLERLTSTDGAETGDAITVLGLLERRARRQGATRPPARTALRAGSHTSGRAAA